MSGPTLTLTLTLTPMPDSPPLSSPPSHKHLRALSGAMMRLLRSLASRADEWATRRAHAITAEEHHVTSAMVNAMGLW